MAVRSACLLSQAITQGDQIPSTLRWEEPCRSATSPMDILYGTCTQGDYPIRALSSPCFLFFRPLIDASSGVRVYGGEITCSSSPIWAYMARKISCSPGNTMVGQVGITAESGSEQHTKPALLQCFHQYATPLSCHHPAGWTCLRRVAPSAQRVSTSQVPLSRADCARVAIMGQDLPTCSEHHTSSSGDENHSQQLCVNCQHPA